ncbi:MAG: efflux transporter periplasmic adaptor subunit [Bacteroidetes bacterium B1(2017)]|nr:MAG: efflux transporter periplasmic adaptor subunit [Bacteroidetes bacterium B1(2017)]
MTQVKKKNNKLLFIGIGAVVVLITIAVIGKKAGWIGKPEGTPVTIAKVERKTIIETVSANGRVQPEKEVKISSDVSGEIRELYVKEGDSVVAGKLLARIDPELYQSALDRSEASLNNTKANLSSSRARLAQAEAKFQEISLAYERNKKMHDQKLISDGEFETAKSTFLNSKAEVEAGKQTVMAAEYNVKSFEATLKESRKSLLRTEIFAPVSGIVSKLVVEKGERVVGTSQMAGTEMMRIANLNDMEVSVDVNENDIIKVGMGDTAEIEVDAYPNRKFKGMVTEIANSATTSAATTSDQVTNFVVKIRILRSSYADLTAQFGKRKSVFRPGMSASVEIQTEHVHDVLAVPIEAVTVRPLSALDTLVKEDDSKDKKPKLENTKDDIEVVFVKQDNKAKIRKVKTGVQDDKFIQIVEGLKADDILISGPYSAISKTLKHDEVIKEVSKDELFDAKKKKDD